MSLQTSTVIWVGEHRLFLDNNNIINVKPSGNVDKKSAELIREAFLKLIEEARGSVNILADLNNAGKPSIEARRVAMEIFHKKEVNSIAFFGLNPVARVIASFIISIAKKKEIRFFKTKEEALDWFAQ